MPAPSTTAGSPTHIPASGLRHMHAALSSGNVYTRYRICRVHGYDTWRLTPQNSQYTRRAEKLGVTYFILCRLKCELAFYETATMSLRPLIITSLIRVQYPCPHLEMSLVAFRAAETGTDLLLRSASAMAHIPVSLWGVSRTRRLDRVRNQGILTATLDASPDTPCSKILPTR
jgi:hypothetical protein